MDELKTEINQSHSAELRTEKDIQKDIHRIVSEVFRLDEMSWGTIGMAILQILFGCVNVWAWRRRPFQVELEAVPRPAPAPMLISAPVPTYPSAMRSLSRRSRKSYSERQQ